jgi:uncharacterized protein (TIGR03437 family)
MQNKRIKLSIIFLLLTGAVAFAPQQYLTARANTSGAPVKFTGAPGEQTCLTCHGGAAVNSAGGVFMLTGLPADYSANQQISLALTISKLQGQSFGFQATALDDAGNPAGTIIMTPGVNTTTLSSDPATGRQYISQSAPGSGPTGGNIGSWTFSWRAPAQKVGRVTFYFAGLVGDGKGNTTGDFVYTLTQSTGTGGGGGPVVGALAGTSAASFASNVPLAPLSIAAAFGNGLTQNVVLATTPTLPTTLDGAELRIRDAAGQEQSVGLFFVSPGQFNFLVPQGTANGQATLTALRNGGVIAQGTVSIDTLSPGLFSANADGVGVPSAVALRVRGGVSTFEPISQLNSQTGRFEAIPIDLSPQNGQVFLIAFGTGFQNNTMLSSASATIGGTPASVQFVGPQGNFQGLDQANILIPSSLASGNGQARSVDVVFSVAGRQANTMQILVR